MSPMKSHKGIAFSERQRLLAEGDVERAEQINRDGRSLDHLARPSTPDPRRAKCLDCGRALHYRRTTYGPHGRKGGWQHTGDGLAQYRSW